MFHLTVQHRSIQIVPPDTRRFSSYSLCRYLHLLDDILVDIIPYHITRYIYIRRTWSTTHRYTDSLNSQVEMRIDFDSVPEYWYLIIQNRAPSAPSCIERHSLEKNTNFVQNHNIIIQNNYDLKPKTIIFYAIYNCNFSREDAIKRKMTKIKARKYFDISGIDLMTVHTLNHEQRKLTFSTKYGNLCNESGCAAYLENILLHSTYKNT